MTYCVAFKTNAGMVLLCDRRTNAGVDIISKYRKMLTWEVPGDRVIAMMTLGNLAITQTVTSLLQENIDKPMDGIDTLLDAEPMFRVADIVGDAMRAVQQCYARNIAQMGESTAPSIIVGGQRAGDGMRLFHV